MSQFFSSIPGKLLKAMLLLNHFLKIVFTLQVILETQETVLPGLGLGLGLGWVEE
jgi:hypothetical protein